ncbi:MAG: hypothetical protein IKV94_00910 [Clostridia bacterium]|nr:hypothetical protein [Clostridia bacterium]
MENRPFFDPYSQFGPNTVSNVPPAYIPPMPNNDYLGPVITPKEFYEQQASYYRYLTSMMDYTMKSREYEKTVHPEKNKNNMN